MDGIVNLLKPTGLTSSDAVARVRRVLGRKDVGHLGTLDPFAAGVLPVAVGKATRLFEYYLGKSKVYRASFLFGYTSPTLDTDGACVPTGRPAPELGAVLRAAGALEGTYPQIPPAVSAKSVGGVRAYELARRGQTPALPAKIVTVSRMRYLRRDAAGGFVFDVACSAGTYIRALARDLGAALGTDAVLCSLIRLACGEWSLSESVTPDELAVLGAGALTPVAEVLRNLPRCEVPPADRGRLDNGAPIAMRELPEPPFTVWCGGVLYGLGKTENGLLKISAYLKGA